MARLPNDWHQVLAAVRKDGLALEYAATSFLRDRGIVLPAVNQNGLALQFAAFELQSDFDIVMAAVNKNNDAFNFASPTLQENDALRHAVGLPPIMFIDDREAMRNAIRRNAWAINFASENLRADEGFLEESFRGCKENKLFDRPPNDGYDADQKFSKRTTQIVATASAQTHDAKTEAEPTDHVMHVGLGLQHIRSGLRPHAIADTIPVTIGASVSETLATGW